LKNSVFNNQKMNFASHTLLYRLNLIFLLTEEYLVKSNQVCARMEIEISDCQPTIAKNVLYFHIDLI
jgi:hypothetical protein